MTISWKTLDVGDKALIYDLDGRARVEVGPQRLFLFREKFIKLGLYTATQNEYLVVKQWDGIVKHIPGPCAIHKNPLESMSIDVVPAVSLDANEVLVVYRRDGKNDEVTRYLRYGPAMFVPAANEWLHTFHWHGKDPTNKTRVIPNAQSFTRLQIVADQIYYNVDEVRTMDDALVRVKLMLFYELIDVEKMLNTTQDPIADLINCLCGDVIAFAARLTYVDFISKAGELSDSCNYPQLSERCETIGYRVNKLVFRGHFASPKLQQTHDHAIEARTRLKIEYEAEEQEQQITDNNLKMELERIVLEQQIETEDLIHQQKLEKSDVIHRLMVQSQEHDAKIKRQQMSDAAELAVQKVRNHSLHELHSALHRMDVRLNDYLRSLRRQPDQIIRIVADKSVEGSPANLHIHQTT